MAVPSPNNSALISIRGLNIGYGSTAVLNDFNLDIPATGVLGVMGPSGVGKSSLLRAVARWNDTEPSYWVSGEILLNGEEILRGKSVGLVHESIMMLPQKARLFTGSILENIIDLKIMHSENPDREEQENLARQVIEHIGRWSEFAPILDEPVMSLSIGRHKMIILARLLAENARCIFLDEPLRDVAVAEEEEFIQVIKNVAQGRSLVLVTHNKLEARGICDTICFITGGRLVEVAPTEQFFTNPATELGKQFLRTGSAWPSSTPESSAEPKPAVPKVLLGIDKVPPPREFHWVIKDLLGGTEYPGLIREQQLDLRALEQLGIKILINLTEKPYQGENLSKYNIRGEFFPIDDMGVPALEDAVQLCARVSDWLDQNTSVVFHCKAGLGRTGTLLACVLVYRGMRASRAIDNVKITNSYYIQSDPQFKFIEEFGEHIGHQ